MKNNLIEHLTISISFDVYFTLKGIDGNVSLEGNPIMRYMMQNFGLFGGLILE